MFSWKFGIGIFIKINKNISVSLVKRLNELMIEWF